MLPAAILAELRAALDDPKDNAGPTSHGGLITEANQLQTYECDGLKAFRVTPEAVVLPRTTEQVQSVIRICAKHNIPFVARGSGTGLSGGALPATGCLLQLMSGLRRSGHTLPTFHIVEILDASIRGLAADHIFIGKKSLNVSL